MATTKGAFKQVLEKELLSMISYLPDKLWDNRKHWNDDVEIPHFARSSETREGRIAELLVAFAKEMYELKLVRDAFSGKRRGYMIEILQSLGTYFDVPEFMDLCSKSLISKSKNEFLSATECLGEHYLATGEIPDEKLITIIDKRIEKTKHKTEAMSGLNLQIKIGLIGEGEALMRIDEWKEKNEEW